MTAKPKKTEAAETPTGPAAVGGTWSEANAKIEKTERLLNLVAFLLSSRTAVPFSKIKGRVAGYDDDATPEALEKRFDRDKAELRSLGVPIVYDPLDDKGDEGYRIPREQYFLPEIRLDVQEAAALAVVQRYAQSSPGDPLARPLQSALRKVLVDSPLTGAMSASVTEQHMLGVRTEKAPGDLSANLALITDAALRRRPLRFRYYAIGRDETSQREVEPYGVGWHEMHWYLVGRDKGRDDVRQFRVDRIRGRARVLSSPGFETPEDFDVSEHVGRPAFLLRRDGKGERVRVELKPEVAFMARGALREGWTFRDLPGGGGLVEFESNDRAAVIRFVARHAERARVVSPDALRREAMATFRAVLAAHEGPPSEPGKRKPARGSGKR